jgi:hypothetical protein
LVERLLAEALSGPASDWVSDYILNEREVGIAAQRAREGPRQRTRRWWRIS